MAVSASPSRRYDMQLDFSWKLALVEILIFNYFYWRFYSYTLFQKYIFYMN